MIMGKAEGLISRPHYRINMRVFVSRVIGGGVRFLLAICLLLFSPTDAFGAWYRVETPKFIFYGTSVKSLKEDALRLERYDTFLRSLLHIPADAVAGKLSVYRLARRTDVVNLHVYQNKDAAGFYDANESGVISVVSASGEDEWQDIVLFHEYAHHLMLQYFPVAYPAWYVEGYAEFLSTVRFEGDRVQFGLPAQHRAEQLFLDQTIPIQTLLTASVQDLKKSQTGNFYGRAWLLTHLLQIPKTRAGQLKAYLQALNAGTPALEAAQQAFGDLAVLHRDMERYLNAHNLSYLSLLFPAPSGVSLSVTTMPPGFGTTVMDRIRLRRGTKPEEREGIAQRLRAAAAANASDPQVWALLAEAELDAEHDEAAIAAADKAIALDPKISRALLWRGLAMMHRLETSSTNTAADWKAARGWVVRANRADTEDPLPLFEFYRSFKRSGETPPPISVDGLAKATALLPQVDSFRLAYVYELAKQARYLDAASYLRPIANAPHGGAEAIYAQKLIIALRKAAAAKPGTVSLSDIYDGLEVPAEEGSPAPVRRPVPLPLSQGALHP